MTLLIALRIALTELRRNLLRSALTSLGILIGVGAVIAMVGLGRGATASIESDLASIGQNLLMLIPGADRGPQARTAARPLSLADSQAIAEQIPHVRATAPQVSAAATVVRGDLDWDTSVTGSTEQYFTVVSWPVVEGRPFTEAESRAGATVCVLGETVREALFGEASAVGSDIRLGDFTCEVIGVLEARGQNTFGMDQDDVILAPIAAVQRRMLGSNDVSIIFISIDRVENIDAAHAAIDELMRRRRSVTSDATLNFQLRDTREMASMISGITGMLTMFLAAVAGVSLLVGGIGIMNIMLVSVTERTREIGIRLAIGALERDVMTQFLVEAIVLSAFGGVLGVMVGILGTWVGSRALDVAFIVDWRAVAGAVLFSALIGVVFGWFPARRAARLEPIDALRAT